MMNQSLKLFGISAVSAAVGLVVGYKLAEHHLSNRFEDRLQEEEELIKEFYSHPARKKYATPEEAVAELIQEPESDYDPREPRQKVSYHKVEKNTESDEEEGARAAEETNPAVAIQHNVFGTVRDTENPYIISQDEFMANDPGFEQATLTYYQTGGVLADLRDDIISDKKAAVGTEFESNFGTGSSDPNVVHVRNEKMQMDFEITHSERSYEEDVLGESAG